MVETISLIFFTLFNAFRIFSYLPQFIKAARDENGASAISYTSWGLFTMANISTALYGWINLRDETMAVLFLVNALGCLSIIAVTWWKRRTLRNPKTLL
ncbi:MAG: hypothetical protein H7X92_04555 [Chitinophagales bacterium]|nr:hypothetical protein [Hyphomicrobiales bacterium]